jgi:hypothetical protein
MRTLRTPESLHQSAIQAKGVEHLWSPAGATGGNPWQMGHPRKRLGQADRQPVATHGNGFGAHGKEDVCHRLPTIPYLLERRSNEEGLVRNPLRRSLVEDFHSPTGHESRQDRPKAKPRIGWPDGRRQFGEVSGAIKSVPAETDADMRMKEVHAEVERLLGGEVSF